MPQAKQVNYDEVAPSYDGRMEGSYLVGVKLALRDLARQVQARRILDLGCGTGRSLQSLADDRQPSPQLYGLDFSAGMLNQARGLNPGYRLVQASAPAPPFAPASFDLIFCAHAFHHFPHKNEVVRAAYSLLHPGGAFAIVNFDPRECQKRDWPIYEYFEGTYETDLTRFPAVPKQEELLREAGFRQISSPVVQLISDDTVGEAIFESYHLQKKACSQLILISAEDYEAGLARMRETIGQAKAKRETAVFRTRLKNRMCHGFKPDSI